MMLKKAYCTFLRIQQYSTLIKSKNQFSTNKQNKEQHDSEQDIESRRVQAEQVNPYTKQQQNRKNFAWTLWRIAFWTSTVLYSYQVYNVFNYDKPTPIQNQSNSIPGFIQMAKLTQKWVYDTIQFFTKPPTQKFLADPIHPDLPQKTLVLNLSGTILHTEFVFGKGKKYVLRPGMAALFNKFKDIYQIIIFTDDDNMLIMNALPSIDPRGQVIRGVFGKQSMSWSNGKYYKDLTYLNRDLKNIVVIDKTRNNVKNHKRNVIVLPQFNGEKEDKQIMNLIPLLTQLAKPQVRDVRAKLQSYGPDPYKNFSQLMNQKIKSIQSKKEGYNKMFSLFGKKEKI